MRCVESSEVLELGLGCIAGGEALGEAFEEHVELEAVAVAAIFIQDVAVGLNDQ